MCKRYVDIMDENGNARNKRSKSRLRTLKNKYQILRDVRSGRAKMQIRHEPPAMWDNRKLYPIWSMQGIQPAISKLRWGAINIVADVGMVKPKCEDTAL